MLNASVRTRPPNMSPRQDIGESGRLSDDKRALPPCRVSCALRTHPYKVVFLFVVYISKSVINKLVL